MAEFVIQIFRYNIDIVKRVNLTFIDDFICVNLDIALFDRTAVCNNGRAQHNIISAFQHAAVRQRVGNFYAQPVGGIQLTIVFKILGFQGNGVAGNRFFVIEIAFRRNGYRVVRLDHVMVA